MASYILTFLAVSSFIHIIAAQCIWKLRDLPLRDPIFYTLGPANRPTFALPTTGLGLILNNGQKARIVCNGDNNVVAKTGKKEAEITCVTDKSILVDGVRGTINDLECKETVMAEVRSMNTKCGDVGTTLNIGYNTRYGWLRLIEVCYDLRALITLYTHHTLYGNLLSVAYFGTDFITSSTAGLPSNVDFKSAYSKANQAIVFRNILGTPSTINDNAIAYGQLASRLDLIYHSWQRSTYFFANFVPQWITIDVGNWELLENLIRLSATTRGSTLKIWTGSYGVLMLSGTKTKGARMYLLNSNRLPIPKYLWKVVCSIQNICTAFVVHNDPADATPRCNSRCHETKWYRDVFEDVKKGHIYCCGLEDFKKNFHVLPRLVSSGILHF